MRGKAQEQAPKEDALPPPKSEKNGQRSSEELAAYSTAETKGV